MALRLATGREPRLGTGDVLMRHDRVTTAAAAGKLRHVWHVGWNRTRGGKGRESDVAQSSRGAPTCRVLCSPPSSDRVPMFPLVSDIGNIETLRGFQRDLYMRERRAKAKESRFNSFSLSGLRGKRAHALSPAQPSSGGCKVQSRYLEQKYLYVRHDVEGVAR